MERIEQLARERRSVRTYDGREISAADMEKLRGFMECAENPYGQKVTFEVLSAAKEGLVCPVVSGTDVYVGGKIRVQEHMNEAFGYSFEMLVMYAQSIGIGTVWLGGTMNRNAFEQAMKLSEDEVMPAASALGYPAEKMSLREIMMRKGIGADSRLPFETLFFDRSFENPLTGEKAGAFKGALEAVRLAPSAVNRQPWRIVLTEDTAHFYLRRSKGFSVGKTLDMQKTDVGIAMCHFDLAVRECGMKTGLVLENPDIGMPAGTEYIASFRLEKA